MPGPESSSLVCESRPRTTAGMMASLVFRSTMQALLPALLADDRLDQPLSGCGDRLRVSPGFLRSPSISSVLVAVGGEQSGEIRRDRRLALMRQHRDEADDLAGRSAAARRRRRAWRCAASRRRRGCGALIATRRMRGVDRTPPLVRARLPGFVPRLRPCRLREAGADDRQIAEEIDVERGAHVVAGAEKALAELLQRADSGAAEQAEHQRQAEHHGLARAGCGRRDCRLREITRALAIGNERCCEASSWRARKAW